MSFHTTLLKACCIKECVLCVVVCVLFCVSGGVVCFVLFVWCVVCFFIQHWSADGENYLLIQHCILSIDVTRLVL